MEKVICDVCGTAYPETATQCPICGCARGDGGQTSAANTVGEDRPAYTYTKGGRFSKSNVRKRLKAAQLQQPPLPVNDPDDENDDYDEDDDQEEPGSNRGLIAIVILLLLAIIAVSSYIAIVHFDLLGSTKQTDPAQTNGTTQSTVPSQSLGGVQIPCKNLSVTDTEITLMAVDSLWQLSYTVDPIDTTDQIKFETSDPNVATVDASGRVTAVGNGEATITITCGDFVSECKVVCNLGGAEKPTDPSVPDVPDVPDVELKLNRTDFTLNAKGSSWKLYSGELDPAEITWSSNNEDVVTVENGKVVAVGVGRTQVVAEYQGQKATCWVSCRWTEEEPTEPTDPSDPSNPSDEPAEVYTLMVNGHISPFGDEENAEVTLAVGETFSLTVENEMGARMEVTWTMSKDGIVSIDGRKVTGASAGKVTLTTTYGEQTFTCVIIVKG